MSAKNENNKKRTNRPESDADGAGKRKEEQPVLEITNIKLTEIKPFENNAKKHPPEQIAQIKRSITDFGMNDPIAIDENNVVIEGHGRMLALQELGAVDAPCIRLDHLSEEQKRAYIIAHNKITLNSGFDMERLAGELHFLEAHTFDVSLTGFSATDIADLFPSFSVGTLEQQGNLSRLEDKRLKQIKCPMCGETFEL